MAMNAPKLTAQQTAKVAKAVGGKSKRKPPTAAQRNARTRVTTNAKISKQKVQSHAAMQQQRVAAAGQIAVIKANVRKEEQEKQQAQRASAARRKAITSAPISGARTLNRSLNNAGSPVPSPAKSLVNPILLILFTWAGIVILYVLITTPENFNNFMGSLRTWVGLLYSSTPMFTTANPNTKNQRDLPT